MHINLNWALYLNALAIKNKKFETLADFAENVGKLAKGRGK